MVAQEELEDVADADERHAHVVGGQGEALLVFAQQAAFGQDALGDEVRQAGVGAAQVR